MRSASMSTTKCRGAVAPALQAAPSLLASVDSQILRRQWVSPATMGGDILAPDFAAIDIGKVDDRRTISTNHAPATTCNGLNRCASDCNVQRPIPGSQIDRRRHPRVAASRRPTTRRIDRVGTDRGQHSLICRKIWPVTRHAEAARDSIRTWYQALRQPPDVASSWPVSDRRLRPSRDGRFVTLCRQW